MQGSSDSKATLGFDPDALRRKYAEERAKRMRPDAAAQYRRLAGKFAQFADDPHVGPRRAFLESCTPSYYNQEGRDTPATALNDIYGAGSVAFFKVLTDWRAQDALHGLEVARKVHSKSDERVSAEYSTQ